MLARTASQAAALIFLLSSGVRIPLARLKALNSAAQFLFWAGLEDQPPVQVPLLPDVPAAFLHFETEGIAQHALKPRGRPFRLTRRPKHVVKRADDTGPDTRPFDVQNLAQMLALRFGYYFLLLYRVRVERLKRNDRDSQGNKNADKAGRCEA